MFFFVMQGKVGAKKALDKARISNAKARSIELVSEPLRLQCSLA